MTDGIHITIKFKEQGKFHALTDAAVFYQHAFCVQFFLQDLRAEPLRDQGNLQIAAVTVVGHTTEVNDSVRIERAGFTLRIQADTHCTGNCLWLCIRKDSRTIGIRLGQFRSMDIFQVILNLVSHENHTSISNE